MIKITLMIMIMLMIIIMPMIPRPIQTHSEQGGHDHHDHAGDHDDL